MALETQVIERDDGTKPEAVSVVDLNQATAEELATLPGIGPALARRIVAHRGERGGFDSPEELASVPGISRAAYERVADRVIVMRPETVLPPTVKEAAAVNEEAPEATLPPPQAPAAQESAPPEAEEAVEAEPISPAEEAPAAEEVAVPPRVETAAPPPSPAPTREPSRRGGMSWLWSALLGGLLGTIFALLVFSGINGSLDLSNSRAVLDVQNQMTNLAAEMTSLRGEVDGLRQRLDTLEGLTARMEKAESAVDTLRQETVALDQRADTVEGELAGISEDLSAMQAQSQQVATFFSQLQSLLREVFGDEPAAGPAPESPLETPTPTE